MRPINVPLTAMVAIGIALTIPVSAPSADSKQLADLSAQWWQWAISIPTPNNLMLDPTGGNCVVGQRGDVWFLAGSFSGGSATRFCSIPEDKALYFPVVNYVIINSPNVRGQGPGNLSVKDRRAWSAAYVDNVNGFAVQLDDKAVNAVRVRSAVFATSMPADNIFVAPCGGDSPAGVYSPSVDDDLYVLLEPLKAGTYTLHFETQNQGVTVQDTTYILTVVPVLRQ